jgi:hypothetical protein
MGDCTIENKKLFEKSKLLISIAIILLLTYLLIEIYAKPKIISQLYQPTPPKGISVIAGNITWTYDNATNSIIILNARNSSTGAPCPSHNYQYCEIEVMKNQKIQFDSPLITIEDNKIRNITTNSSTWWWPISFYINQTGNITIMNFTTTP